MKNILKYLFIITLLFTSIIGYRNVFAEPEITSIEIKVLFQGQEAKAGRDNSFTAVVTGSDLNEINSGAIIYSKNNEAIDCNDINPTEWITKNSNSTDTKLIFNKTKKIPILDTGDYTVKLCLKKSDENIIDTGDTGTKEIYIRSAVFIEQDNGVIGKLSFYCPKCDNKNIGLNFLDENEKIRIQTSPGRDRSNQYVNHTYKIKIEQNNNIVFQKVYSMNLDHIQNYFDVKGDYCENIGTDDCIKCSIKGTLEIFDSNNHISQRLETDQIEWNCKDNDKLKELWEDEGGGSTSTNLINKCKTSLEKDGAVSFTYIEETENKSILSINTKECKNIPLEIEFSGNKNPSLQDLVPGQWVWTAIAAFVNVNLDNYYTGVNTTTIAVTPIEDNVTIELVINDDSCYTSNDPDCLISTQISSEGTSIYNSDDKLKEYYEDYVSNHQINSDVFNNGAIITRCTGITTCGDSSWIILKMTGILNQINYPKSIPTTQALDTNNPCYVDDAGNGLPGYDPDCYEFLAPIQGIELDSIGNQDNKTFKIDKDPETGRNRIAIRKISDYELGNYINKLFQIAIEILGVISVIMIIIAGVQYMTVESVYGKSDAKQRITNAVTGLLLALGIFTILHTINPKLLEVNFGKDIKNVFIETDDSPPTVNADGTIGNSDIVYGSDWPPSGSNYKTLRKGGVDSLETIIDGVYINKKECTTAGKNTKGGDDCTSVYFTPEAFAKVKNGLEKLKANSNSAKIVITGGSEFWWHGTHKANKPIVDIRSSSAGDNSGPLLSNFLSGNHDYPGQCYERSAIPGAESYIEFALDESGKTEAQPKSLCDKANKIYPTPDLVKTHRNNGIIKKGATQTKVRSCCWNPTEHWHIVFK